MKETRRLNLRLEFVGRGPRQRARVRVAGKERGRDLVDALVGALRRKDRRDQEFVGGAKLSSVSALGCWLPRRLRIRRVSAVDFGGDGMLRREAARLDMPPL